MCDCDELDTVCSVVIGLTATTEDEKHTAYIDGIYKYDEENKPTIEEFKAGASALVSQFAADNGWIASLDAQIEATKKQDVPVPDFVAPEITVDTTVEPTPEPEPIPEPEPVVDEDTSEEEGDTDEEG
ncbi:MAG: hypothetical protein CMM02_21810 [Rhodopirellula sp.]|nr:hypothetical protein [Rhodopirellula sp.]|tara:strand:+ start:263 stop:646 length:384 start_codon:yes stop_codon:yes gene_type:complete